MLMGLPAGLRLLALPLTSSVPLLLLLLLVVVVLLLLVLLLLLQRAVNQLNTKFLDNSCRG